MTAWSAAAIAGRGRSGRCANPFLHGVLVLGALLWCPAADCAPGTDVDNGALSDSAAGTDWAGYGRTFDQQRFSPLKQINTTTVKRLGLASWFDLPGIANVSSAPLEAHGVVYLAVGLSVVYAVDAVGGKLLWKYDPHVTGPKMRLAWGSRGLALWGKNVYVGTLDGRLIALAADNGKLVWETQTLPADDARYITGAPLVYNNKVLIGHGGGDFSGVRGYVTAYDATGGRQLWRFYTVPGDPHKGFENPTMEKASRTWTGQWWQYGGGGTVWNTMTYDSELNRVYLGTGNGSPTNRKIRSPGGGDNLFISSVVALDADSGAYVWHYQTTPGESWDFDACQEVILTTLAVDGHSRKVLMQASKNGFFYVIDRETGKLLSADKFARATWAQRVDLATGRPVETANARYETGATTIWPGIFGARGWQPMSFDPDTHLVYIPGRDMRGDYNDRDVDPMTWQLGRGNPAAVNTLDLVNGLPEDVGHSWLLAWDPLARKQVWRVPLPGITPSGTITTHGGLVFQPNAAGKFVAFNAKSGERLWSFDMGVGSNAVPITYSVEGKQYVSVLSGWTAQSMMFGSVSAQSGWVGTTHPRRLLTFALDSTKALPASAPPGQPVALREPDFQIAPAKAERGMILYGQCVSCHGLGVVAGGYAPDLRASPIVTSAPAFDSVVREGTLESQGMPKFAEFSPDDSESLRHFIRSRARASAEHR